LTDVASRTAALYRPKLFASPAAAAVCRMAVHDSRNDPVASTWEVAVLPAPGVADVAGPVTEVAGPEAG
jgi:hypothetical protein